MEKILSGSENMQIWYWRKIIRNEWTFLRLKREEKEDFSLKGSSLITLMFSFEKLFCFKILCFVEFIWVRIILSQMGRRAQYFCVLPKRKLAGIIKKKENW